jgi:broad specificity phosphatase PhoE
MELYVIKHGRTDANEHRIMDGIEAIHLNEIGIKQCMDVRDRLGNIKFDLIICSPLSRTIETVNIINMKNYPVIYDDRVKGRYYGEFAGKSFDELDRDFYWNYYDKTEYISAERIKYLFERVYKFLDELKEKYRDKTILVVTHSGIAKVINCYFNGIPEDGNLQPLRQANCEFKIYKV